MKDDNAGQRPAEPVLSDYDQNPGRVRLARYLPDGTWVGLDNSQTMLDRTPPGGVLGEATALPFLGESFDGVVPLLFGSRLELEVTAQNTDARARESPPPQSTFWPIPLHPLPLYKCVSADRRISQWSREEARRCTER